MQNLRLVVDSKIKEFFSLLKSGAQDIEIIDSLVTDVKQGKYS